MRSNTTKSLFLILSVTMVMLSCIGVTDSRSAEKYPSRPVETANGLAAGGPGDITNRIVAKYLEKYLGVPFVPINKPGPAQMMAASYVAKARPDGYTIGQLSNAVIIAELTGEASGYTMNELRPICQISGNGLTIVVPIDSPWKTWQDFVDYAKKNPGVKYGHTGVGGGPNQRMELLNKYAKLGMVGIPFKGEGEVIPMLLGKHIPIAPISPAAAKTQADAGKVRILAAFDSPAAYGLDPALPNLSNLYKGMPDLPTKVYMWAPSKTPDDIVRILDQAFAKMAKDPESVAEFKRDNIMLIYVDGDTVIKQMPEMMKLYRAAVEALGLLKK
jgi:tripartite-type tricarboxylate transporter receptor subunit TctC